MSLSLSSPTPTSAAPNFDRLARIYPWMEWLTFGPWLQRCRCFFLEDLRHCRRALVLGDGDGRFTARVLRHNAAIRVDAIDSSRSMLLELLRRSGSARARVEIHMADVRVWTPQESKYDVIATHFFLDCLSIDEIELLARRVRSRVRHNAVWVVSEFNKPDGWFGCFVARPLISFLYWTFGVLTGLEVRRLPEYRKALAKGGFVLTRQHHSLGGLLVSEIWEPLGKRPFADTA